MWSRGSSGVCFFVFVDILLRFAVGRVLPTTFRLDRRRCKSDKRTSFVYFVRARARVCIYYTRRVLTFFHYYVTVRVRVPIGS